MTVESARIEIALKTKKGLSFILASVILWIAILVVWLLPIQDVLTRNLLTFCVSTPLLPLAYMISKVIKADFSLGDNPLSKLGFLFSLNQILYILIEMWAYASAPYSMVMIVAMVFGAHLFPFSWLYISRTYLVMSIIIPIASLIIGCIISREHTYYIPLFMAIIEIIFSCILAFEVKRFNELYK